MEFNAEGYHVQLQQILKSNATKMNADDYYFKRCHSSLQNMAFCLLKGDLLHCKRSPFAHYSKACGNRKKKILKHNKHKCLPRGSSN